MPERVRPQEFPSFSRRAALKELPAVVVTTLREGPWYFAVSIVREVRARAFPLILAWLGAQVISGLPRIVHGTPRALYELSGYVLAIALTTLASSFLSIVITYAEDRLGTEFEIVLTTRVRRALAYMPFHYYENRDILDRFDRVENFIGQLKSFVQDMIISPVSALVITVIALQAFVQISWILALLIVLAFVPFVVLRLKLSKERDQRWSQVNKLFRLKRAHELLLTGDALKETRLLGMMSYVLNAWKKHWLETERSDQRFRLRRQKLDFADTALRHGFLAITLILTLRSIAQGLRPIGTFIYIQILAEQYLDSLSSFVFLSENSDTFLRQLSDYVAIMKLPVYPAREARIIHKPLIEFNRVSFAYPKSETPVLTNISLTIPFGSTVAIVGENGAGKTTLVKLVMGLFQPTTGKILVNSQNLTELDHGAWAKSIGVLFQDFQTYEDFTVREAVWFGNSEKSADDESIMAALKQAGALDFVKQLPQGLDTYMSTWMDKDNGLDLSGGQRQRIAIARTLFRNPDILIMDEPTSAIDAKAEYEIFKELEKVRQNKTTILISHRFSTVRKANTILVLDKGCIIEVGSHAELMAKQGMYFSLFTKQAEGYF